MKHVKSIVTGVMITILLVGSFGLLLGNINDNASEESTTIGMFTTQEDPDPIRD